MASTVERAEYAVLQDILKRACEAKGISQRNLSAKLGKMSSYIQKIESGERRIDVIEFLRISDTWTFEPHFRFDGTVASEA